MSGDYDLPDDDATRELARAMHAEVDSLEVSSDSLARIQARTAASGGRTGWRWLAPLAAAAVVAVVAVGAVLVPRGGDGTAGPPATTTSPTPSASQPTVSSSPSPTKPSEGPSHTPSATGTGGGQPSKTGGATAGGCLGAGRSGYAYYVSDLNGEGPRLYRGTASISCHLGLEESLNVPVGKDPDFGSGWPAGTKVLSLTVAGSVADVDLSAFPSGGSQAESIAIQQLVYTLTANRPTVSSVRFTVNGGAPQGSLDWSKPVRRASALAVVANVWILTPHNNAAVGSPVSVLVNGTGFEGQVPIKVFKDGSEVASTVVTTRMGGFAQASTTLDLPPGLYEIRAYNDNGQDDSLTLWDTKVFTVR